MKTLSLFVLILLSLSSFSQNPGKSEKALSQANSLLLAETPSFSITKIYPNPVKDVVSVDFYAEQSGMIQLKLYNILGTEIKTLQAVYVSSTDQTLKLDLSFLKSGVYILKFAKSDQTVSQVIRKN